MHSKSEKLELSRAKLYSVQLKRIKKYDEKQYEVVKNFADTLIYGKFIVYFEG